MATVKCECRPPSINVNIGGTRGGNADIYTGEYTVTPKAGEATVLRTKNKLLAENITVSRVPFYEVGNQSGGKTFIIGEVQDV